MVFRIRCWLTEEGFSELCIYFAAIIPRDDYGAVISRCADGGLVEQRIGMEAV